MGFGDLSMGRGTFGGEFGQISQRRGPLPKLLWADLLSYCTNTVFILFQFILLHSSYGMQLFSAHGAILLSTELAPLLEDGDEKNRIPWKFSMLC